MSEVQDAWYKCGDCGEEFPRPAELTSPYVVQCSRCCGDAQRVSGAGGDTDTQEKIRVACDSIRDMLLAKNKAYGDSAINPLRVFSSADPAEQLRVRIDDKLSRLARGQQKEQVPEDTVRDLIGYLVFLLVLQED